MKTYPEVKLNPLQRQKIEDLWFVYGNRGPKHTDNGHRFIQNILERGKDLRSFFKPFREVIEAVDAILKRETNNERDLSRDKV